MDVTIGMDEESFQHLRGEGLFSLSEGEAEEVEANVPLLKGGASTTDLLDIQKHDLNGDIYVKAISGSFIKGFGGLPLGTWRFLCLLYLIGFWFWSLVNAHEASEDRLFIQLSSFNIMMVISFLISSAYYSFRISTTMPNMPLDTTEYDLWLPHVSRILFETTMSISSVLFVFFWMAEYNSSDTKDIDLVFAINEHCVVFFILFCELFMNKILFHLQDMFAVVLLTVVVLISDAYASASYGVTPEIFSSSEVSIVMYVAVILFTIIAFIAALGVKNYFFTKSKKSSRSRRNPYDDKKVTAATSRETTPLRQEVRVAKILLKDTPEDGKKRKLKKKVLVRKKKEKDPEL